MEYAVTAKNQKYNEVVENIFPEYDWVKQIAGKEADNMDLTIRVRKTFHAEHLWKKNIQVKKQIRKNVGLFLYI